MNCYQQGHPPIRSEIDWNFRAIS